MEVARRGEELVSCSDLTGWLALLAVASYSHSDTMQYFSTFDRLFSLSVFFKTKKDRKFCY